MVGEDPGVWIRSGRTACRWWRLERALVYKPAGADFRAVGVQGFLGVIGVEGQYIYSRFVKTSGHARERGRSINHTQGQRKPRNPMLEADRSTTDENSKMQLMIHLATSPCTDHITGFIQHLVIIKHVTII